MQFDSSRLQTADQLGVITNRVARLMESQARPLLAGTGVEGSTMRIMSEIAEAGGPLRPSDLASRLQSDRSTISRQLRTGTERGLIIIEPDPTDNRSAVVGLTGEGRLAYTTIRQRRAELLASMLDGLQPYEIRQLLTLLTELDNVFRSPSAAD